MSSAKTVALLFSLAAPFAHANLPPFPAPTDPFGNALPPRPPAAEIFSGDLFLGTSLNLPSGVYDYDLLASQGFNRTIGSVLIPDQYKVIMCSDANLGGQCQTFMASTATVVVGNGVASLRVAAVTSPPSRAPTSAPTMSRRNECLSKGYTLQQCLSNGYRNRNLRTVNTRFLIQDHEECMDVRFDMYLVVEGVHFAGLAVPFSKDCPSVVFHSSIGKNKLVEKVVMIADPEEVATFDSSSMHHLGSRPFGNIVQAFEDAPVGKDGAKFYDSITNNCVSLLRNMADPLSVSVDDAMINFVTQKLLNTGDIKLWEGIKNSPGLNLVVAGGKRMLQAANDEELVRKLIKLYV